MSNFAVQIEEIKTLISSETHSQKSFAYSTLLNLLGQSTATDEVDDSSVQILVKQSHSLISLILSGITSNDEEIAAQALKCLGFVIYHPSVVASISGNDVDLVVETLVEVITSTKAVIHALDNPHGSLSTTFEAFQGVMKLATQLSRKMRDKSCIWVPPIYRRLIRNDKRERDMSERCMSKIKAIILPPTPSLSKALVQDMKLTLIPGMKELMKHGLKAQGMQAWGWFIRLLGSYALKKRHLLNEMLKYPEQTFCDHDPQAQIASLAAWEGLVDALVHPPLQCSRTHSGPKHSVQQLGASEVIPSESQPLQFYKILKLILTPLVGIMSSKCDASVHSSCLSTWCYLLHKLDTAVNLPSVIQAVVAPILHTVFQIGPDSKSIWLWNICVDMFNNFIFAKLRTVDSEFEVNNGIACEFSDRTLPAPPISGKCPWKPYPVKWLPWGFHHLDFQIQMLHVLICQQSLAHDNRNLICDASLRAFRFIMKGVQTEFKEPSTSYDEIMQCLNTILKFVRMTFEGLTSQNSTISDLQHLCLGFVECVIEELDLSILGSPLYKVVLDLKYIADLKSASDSRHSKLLGVDCDLHMKMVSPLVYLNALYFCVVVSMSHALCKNIIPLKTQKQLKILLCSYDPLASLHVIIPLLYQYIGSHKLIMWEILAEVLKEYIGGAKNISWLKTESCNDGYSVIHHILFYPLVVFSCHQQQLSQEKEKGVPVLCPFSSHREPELEHLIEVWRLLYGSVISALTFEHSITNAFTEDLCSMLNKYLDENPCKPCCDVEAKSRDQSKKVDFLFLCSGVVECVFEQTLRVIERPKGNKNADGNERSNINNSLEFTARLMKLSVTETGNDLPPLHALTGVFSALARLVIGDALLRWVSKVEVKEQSIIQQLQSLWSETLNCLKRSQPPIIFDSSFLNFQASLLEKALDHPCTFISEPTIAFWNATYCEQITLDYPDNLLRVLDRLSRSGKINLHKNNTLFSWKHPPTEVVSAPQRCKVSATHNSISKRVEFRQYGNNNVKNNKVVVPVDPKRKRLELTQHQKEVRRAQQGRERDCSGHGPGIRTYASVDFSQGNEEESQES
ncbi:Telomere-associated protein Rif1, N-terminal [Dillenia turbinata]|uniref:Telomere-associated protein Rif1, N-terminal n=1 Tax=Dillenia turbinata TaxID=194707 RepID=A0AAN8WB87_9MAGN